MRPSGTVLPSSCRRASVIYSGTRFFPFRRHPMSTSEPPTPGPPPDPPTTQEDLATLAYPRAGSGPAVALDSPGCRYRVLRFHARGGMGEVSVALDREVGRE